MKTEGAIANAADPSIKFRSREIFFPQLITIEEGERARWQLIHVCFRYQEYMEYIWSLLVRKYYFVHMHKDINFQVLNLCFFHPSILLSFTQLNSCLEPIKNSSMGDWGFVKFNNTLSRLLRLPWLMAVTFVAVSLWWQSAILFTKVLLPAVRYSAQVLLVSGKIPVLFCHRYLSVIKPKTLPETSRIAHFAQLATTNYG